MVTPLAPAHEDAPTASTHGRRPVWALPIVILAVIAVGVAFAIGIVGLTANPVKSVNADGVTRLQGTFEPYQCDSTSCDGYIQAGARSVFVQFPRGCTPPPRGAEISLTARSAPDLGKGSYRAIGCA